MEPKNPEIIFQNNDFAVINKPSGLIVNRADTTAGVTTLQDWAETNLHLQFPQEENLSREDQEFSSRGGIVHRLDKDTSGLLVIAKNPGAFAALKLQFQGRTVEKKYLALVHGKVTPPEGTVDAPIERNPFNRKHFGIFPGGREAVTQYRTLKNLQYREGKTTEDLTLLEVFPHTGRTHQIRVHLKYLNYPIVSDPIYGGRKQTRDDLKWCPRLFLHAANLKFNDPTSRESLEFTSDLPADLEEILKNFA